MCFGHGIICPFLTRLFSVVSSFIRIFLKPTINSSSCEIIGRVECELIEQKNLNMARRPLISLN